MRQTLKIKILSIIIANTDEDGWQDTKAIGKQVIWLMRQKRYKTKKDNTKIT